MTPIPKAIRKIIDSDPFYKTCALYGQPGHDECEGRVTLDHAVIYAGKQIQEPWAIVPICAKGHGVDEFQDKPSVSKEMRLWVALNRATEADLTLISKASDYLRTRENLNKKYGPYIPTIPNPLDLHQPAPMQSKKNWYLITKEDYAKIDKIRCFYRKALGVNKLPREVITCSLEEAYLQIRDALLEKDPELYELIGFEK